LSVAHVERHVVAPQMYGVQPLPVDGRQTPPPVQVPALVKTPLLQAFFPQLVALSGSSQVPRVEPSHVATLQTGSVPVIVHAARAPCGAVFAGTGEQTPRRPATSHASHWPPHAVLQQ
jgi:hypothetical protein